MTMTMTRTIINHRISTEVVRSDGTSLGIIGIVVAVGVDLITREVVEVINASVITVASDIGNALGSGRGFCLIHVSTLIKSERLTMVYNTLYS
jgi:hypothetical protein